MDHEKTGDYGRSFGNYQTTMGESLSEAIDYDSITHGKMCPIFASGLVIAGHTRADEHLARCGPRCAWWDADKERCAVLSIARNK